MKLTNKNKHNLVLESCKYWSINKKIKLIKLIIEFAIKEKLFFKRFV
jgi:hypothetical protein